MYGHSSDSKIEESLTDRKKTIAKQEEKEKEGKC